MVKSTVGNVGSARPSSPPDIKFSQFGHALALLIFSFHRNQAPQL